MPIRAVTSRPRHNRHDSCNDQVIGAILSGWRYDISGISPAMRVDYEEHLASCAHCRARQHKHRTIDVLLLCAFTLTFVAFLLAVLVIHYVEVVTHLGNVHMHLHETLPAHISPSITISLQAVAIAGLVVSLLLAVLVAMATPIPGIVTGYVRQRGPELRDRLFKHAA